VSAAKPTGVPLLNGYPRPACSVKYIEPTKSNDFRELPVNSLPIMVIIIDAD